VMFVLEGTGEVILETETRRVGPMTALFYPEHVLHGLRNIGSTPITYLVVRVR
jgi:mannose-6-phosphate isomerase-like protein (cupin superfamily)